MLDDGEVEGGVVGPHTAFVVPEHHVEHPVEAVFDHPMTADHRSHSVGEQGQRGDVEARLGLCLAIGFAFALDHDDRLQAGPLVAVLQPADVVENSDRPGLDAAVVAVDGRVLTDRCILECYRLLLLGEQLDIVAQRALVAFQREDVVGLLVDDCLRDFALATRSVDGHHCALDGQKLEQGGNGDDLVRLVSDFGLTEHHALARGEGGDDMDGLFGPLLLVGAPHRLAVDGDHLGRRLRQRRRPRHKTALEPDRIEPGEDDAQLVVRGRAVLEASKTLKERQLGPAEARNIGHRLRPRQRRRQHQEQHLVERIGDLSLLPVVRQVPNANLRRQMDENGSTSRRLIVTVDGRFTNSTVLRQLPERTVLVGRVRKDSAFFYPPESQPERGRKRKYGLRCPTPEALLKDPTVPWQTVKAHAAGQTYEFKVKTLGPVYTAMDQGQKALRLVVVEPVPYRASQKSKLQRREPAYLICTDPELPLQELLQVYLWRWDIEVNFRDEKTLLGVGQAQVRSESSNQNAPALAVASYAMLLLASVKTYGAEGKPDTFQSPLWYQRKPEKRATTNELINQLRWELWSEHAQNQFCRLLTHHRRRPERHKMRSPARIRSLSKHQMKQKKPNSRHGRDARCYCWQSRSLVQEE